MSAMLCSTVIWCWAGRAQLVYQSYFCSEQTPAAAAANEVDESGKYELKDTAEFVDNFCGFITKS